MVEIVDFLFIGPLRFIPLVLSESGVVRGKEGLLCISASRPRKRATQADLAASLPVLFILIYSRHKLA